MTDTINNVPSELKPCPFCGGEADPKGWMSSDGAHGPACDSCGATANSADEWNARAPSPAGVDGLEAVGTLRYFMDYPDSPHNAPGYITHQFNPASWDHAGEAAGEHKLCRLSDAQAIIDGLRGEVAGLRKRAKTAEREAGSALRTYKGLEKVARVVSDNSDQVCGELNVLRQQFDQQAQRIGELEGLLRDFAYHTQRREMPTESSLAEWADRIDAALAAVCAAAPNIATTSEHSGS